MAVAELVGHDQVGFRPQRDHRLVAAPALIVGIGGLFVALDKGGVLVDGGDAQPSAVLLMERGDVAYATCLHLLQPATALLLGTMKLSWLSRDGR